MIPRCWAASQESLRKFAYVSRSGRHTAEPQVRPRVKCPNDSFRDDFGMEDHDEDNVLAKMQTGI